MEKLKISDVRAYQKIRKGLKTIGGFKNLGREMRDRYGLTDKEAIAILDSDHEAILLILEKQEDKKCLKV